ncbi:hypothetical protein GCM10011577_39790 [Pseudarthrobacter polychromogenes]|uniref:Uncharacterized protein n=1 Tax=Pseudarthrobacter polychromogenes TaxID=1676 RepID=A0ABQ1Y3D6_9MICC|nr:hypothetical protein GCM10011577_39790 [Pseudarthrobacter polychromogenes]
MTGVLDYELRGLEKLSVITPGINTHAGVDHSEGTEVNGLGGRLRSLSQSFVGPLTEAALERMTIDRVSPGAGDGTCEADHIKTRLSPWPGAGVLSMCWADSSKLGSSPSTPESALHSHGSGGGRRRRPREGAEVPAHGGTG